MCILTLFCDETEYRLQSAAKTEFEIEYIQRSSFIPINRLYSYVQQKHKTIAKEGRQDAGAAIPRAKTSSVLSPAGRQ